MTIKTFSSTIFCYLRLNVISFCHSKPKVTFCYFAFCWAMHVFLHIKYILVFRFKNYIQSRSPDIVHLREEKKNSKHVKKFKKKYEKINYINESKDTFHSSDLHNFKPPIRLFSRSIWTWSKIESYIYWMDSKLNIYFFVYMVKGTVRNLFFSFCV